MKLNKENWQTMAFSDFAENVAVRVDPSEANTEVYVGLEHLDPSTIHLKAWGHPSEVTGQKLSFKKGDVVFGRRRAYQRKLAVADRDGICSAHAMVIRSKPNVMLSDFLPFFLWSDVFMERAVAISVGSLSPTINWKTLKQQRFLVPSLQEQEKILSVLTQANKTVEKYTSLSSSLNQYFECLIKETLRPTINGKKLGDYCNKDGIKIGPFGSLLHVSDYQDDGIPVVMPTDMNEGKIVNDNIAKISDIKAQELKNYQLQENDILFPRRGDLTKRAIVSKHEENWLCGTGSIRVRLKNPKNAKAIFFALTSIHTNRWLERFSVGTTMPNLNASTIHKIPLTIPNGIEGEIFIQKIDSLMETIEKNKILIKASIQLRTKLISQLIGK